MLHEVLLTGGRQPCMTAICSCPCERCSSQGIGSATHRGPSAMYDSNMFLSVWKVFKSGYW